MLVLMEGRQQHKKPPALYRAWPGSRHITQPRVCMQDHHRAMQHAVEDSPGNGMQRG